MSYLKRIDIYTINADFNIPLASNMNKCINLKVGEYVIIFDNEVWLRDTTISDERLGDENFAKASITPQFVIANIPLLFKQHT